MTFAAIVVFYNPDDGAIARVKTYSDCFSKVIVVDNSEIEDLEVRKKLDVYNNCNYYKMSGNEGMAKALNFGFSIIHDFDFVLTMDQDSIYTAENINNMKKFIESNEDNDIAIFSANYAKMYYNKQNENFSEASLAIPKDSVKEVAFCMTSGSFVRIEYLKQLNPLEDLFIGYVDNLLCFNFILNGNKLVRVGCSYFAQQVGNSVSDKFFNKIFHILNHSQIRYYYMVRNNMYLQKKFKYNRKIKSFLRFSMFRILFNLVVGENKKVKKIIACLEGRKDYKNNILGPISDESLKKIQ